MNLIIEMHIIQFYFVASLILYTRDYHDSYHARVSTTPNEII
jgi:hypothetical protein